MSRKTVKPLAVLLIIWGTLSYLILVPELWWVGLIFAGLTVVVGGATLKKYHIFSVVSMLLAIVACFIFVITIKA